MDITKEGVAIDVLIGTIKKSLRRAGVSPGSSQGDLQVNSVQLVLNIVATESAGGRLDLRVPFAGMKLSMGAKVTKQDTHSITMNLMPPAPGQQLRETRGDIETVLVDAIDAIRSGMASAAEGDEPWFLSTGEVEISFVITKEGSISLGAEGELSNEVTNKLVLTLKPRV
jgi:hypothetical protein